MRQINYDLIKKKQDSAYNKLRMIGDIIENLHYPYDFDVKYNLSTFENEELSDFTITIKGKIK